MKAFILISLLAITVNCIPMQSALLAKVSDVHQGQSDSIVVDVTRDFINSIGEETLLQVNLAVQVVSGVLHINGQPAPLFGMIVSMKVNADVVSRNRFTNTVISTHVAPVVIQIHLQSTVSTNGMKSINLQETITEVDGTEITQIDVQEAIFEVDVNGNEVSRQITGHIALTQSRLAALATTTTTTTSIPNGLLPDETVKSDSDSDSSDSDSDSDAQGVHNHHGDHDSHKICHRFAAWFHRQKLAVRVVLVAIAAFVFCFVLNFLFCCLMGWCCPRKSQQPQTKRDVYLNNVKLHYVPINMNDDDDELTKKVTVA